MEEYIQYDKRRQKLIRNKVVEAFNSISPSKRIADLIDFHAKNKYLFMTFHPEKLKVLGRIIANADNLPVPEVFISYQKSLTEILSLDSTHKNRINTVMHIYGYFKSKLNQKEKERYLKIINEFADDEALYSEVLTELCDLAKIHNMDYLLKQTIFKYNHN